MCVKGFRIVRVNDPEGTGHLLDLGESNSVEIPCPSCGKPLIIELRYLNKTVTCRCGQPFRLEADQNLL